MSEVHFSFQFPGELNVASKMGLPEETFLSCMASENIAFDRVFYHPETECVVWTFLEDNDFYKRIRGFSEKYESQKLQ